MLNQGLLAVLIAVSQASRVLGQSTSTDNPLNAFISAAGSAVAAISSANAQETHSATSTQSSLSTTPTPTSAASTAATSPTSHGLSTKTKLEIIIPVVVVGLLLLLGILLCAYCCVRRRRRRRARRTVTPIADEEFNSWRRPSNGGRAYAPVHHETQSVNMEQQPTVPLMASVHHPATHEHPAYRQENPFVPVPPPTRKPTANSRSGLGGGIVPGAEGYTGVAGSPGRLHKSRSIPRNSSRTGLNSEYNELRDNHTPLPTHTGIDRPSTPFGLSGVAEPHKSRNNGPYNQIGEGPFDDINVSHEADHRYSSIGQPYSDMHVHHLVNDEPSHALRGTPYGASDFVPHHSTPPMALGRSPQRYGHNRDSTYNSYSTDASGKGDSPSNSGSAESWQTTQTGIVPDPPAAPWEERERRWSESARERSYSRSPRQSMSEVRRQSQSRNGTPKRLRFSDFQNDEVYDGHNAYHGVGQAM